MTPSDGPAVREAVDLLDFAATGTRNRMRQVAGPPAASRHGTPIVLVRRAPIFQYFVHRSVTYYSARQRKKKPAQENDGTF
jgi:hypothetical protein